ncbi:SnoaL-domain-containing protein [Annulohypoxylon truncatum]|uniref:SnoaL-domain-containing protein n=1 Tax=Annulohypoxylon truncatum TaxID=327061 RepID=UPI0020080B1A|nr:SnoaL-domain-containing protein [Annulohypoxylon truncatum]KAI1209683.1 SnoaL-domain-containing protein [Annulohypoxylon truncatum]
MSATTPQLLATIRSWAKCVNEKKWDKLPRYMHSTYNQNGIDYTPESWAAHIREHVAPQLGGDVRINEDSIMVDESAQCVALSLWLKFKPEMPLLGYQPKGRDVLFIERGFIWFTDGKLSKGLFVINDDEMRTQMANPGTDFAPSLISEYPVPPVRTPLSREQLEEVYRAYVDMFNSRETDTAYSKYVHQPEKMLNNKNLARRIMDDAMAAIPDLQCQIHTLVADEKLQRVAVWLKFSGTPVKEYAGLVANGDPVFFTEQATYQFLDGKIERIWGMMDFSEARLAQQPQSTMPLVIPVI